jgi:ABC-type sugar transport system ATPase subunit
MSTREAIHPEPPPSLLVARSIRKRFGGVRALDRVDFEVRRGEVHALVGENGAGKSTLMHILAGVFPPDAGSIEWEGRESTGFADENAAQRARIAIVFQERSLFGPLSIAENIFAGRQPVDRWGFIDRREQRRRSSALLARVGLDADPDMPVERLSSARQQLVEVAKALSIDAQLIIFDEPTAALTLAETETLFRVIGQLRDRQLGVIYISHRLEEVFRIANRVTVLKDGRGEGTDPVGRVTSRDLVSRMVGRGLDPRRHRPERPSEDAPVALEVRGLTDPPGCRPRLVEVSLRVRAGEIVALAGLVGAGRTELALAIFGSRPDVRGDIFVQGRRIQPRSAADAIAEGLGYLSEDRKEDGLFLEMSVADNILAVDRRERGGWRHDARAGRAAANELCRSLRVVCRGPDEPVGRLSGGNQQKVALAKWLRVRPSVLIVDEPTRGVDVGAKAEIHELLFELARGGTALVVISSELPEVLAVADRILVMREGRLVGEIGRDEATEDLIMELAAIGPDEGRP